MVKAYRFIFSFLGILFLLASSARAQQTLGSINGTVTDSSGGVISGASIKARNIGTNLEQTATSKNDGSFNIADLPIGTYEVTFSKGGFKTEVHSQILLQGDRTTTVNSSLQPGEVSSQVTVTATPLLNQTDTTNGYILGSELIQSTPLGTGSFTQLAILSPGVSADPLNGSGSNAGLGNQAIFANGQRDTSNSFSFNGVNANNLFNGKSTSQVSANRFVLNTAQNMISGGEIQTSTSVYDAIGNGLPSAPPETLEELRVDTAMYDASQGANSGAHIGQTTKSGTNDFHGQVYEYFQNNVMNAASFFRNSDPTIPAGQKVPALHYNRFGGTLGGPIIHNKMFFFGSYQGTRVNDQLLAASPVAVPPSLSNDRTALGIVTAVNTDFGSALTPNQVDPVALALLNAKNKDGSFFIPSSQSPPPVGVVNGHSATIQGPPATFRADQFNGNIDYEFSDKDRFAAKYFFQHAPSTNPFAVSQLEGSTQKLNAGGQALSLINTRVVTPNLTWEQRAGFIRERAFASTAQPFGPTNIGGSGQSINVFGSPFLPGISISNSDNSFDSLAMGYAGSAFANAGLFQNQFELATNMNWVHGHHTISAGINWDYSQLNVINKNNQTAGLAFSSFVNFVTGTLRSGLANTVYLNGSSNRYYRAHQVGTYVSDNFKLQPNLTVVYGLRWDWDGPLTEKNGMMTNFYPKTFSYDLTSDSFSNIGLVVAGNNKDFGTKGVSNSTLTGRQWGFGPRIGIVWSPSRLKNVVVRTSFGLYYDRGEYFTEFSPSAGFGFNGPFGVTVEPPFVSAITNSCGTAGCISAPFGATAPPPPPKNLSGVIALVPNKAAMSTCNSTDPGFPFNCNVSPANPFLFGGYDPTNKLPYSENWALDLQWQPINSVAMTLAYVGNRTLHQPIPIAFNQPGIATPINKINGETSSYGYNVGAAEPVATATGGNTDLRATYLGYSPNSVFYKGEGISNYHALQFQVTKRLTHGLQVAGSYTWSHTLDEQSGLGLFFTGNDPLNPHSAYASSDFDRTHVLTVSYLYALPKFSKASGFSDKALNGWGLSGITVAQSGQPYSIYDFSGGVASVYFGTNNFIGNPIVPLLPGQTPASAQKVPPCSAPGGPEPSCSGPTLVNIAAFGVPLIPGGQMGVPADDPFETSYGTTGRNIFRAPFQVRFDMSLFKETKLNEKFALRFDANAFNIFNHPAFDAPNNNVAFNPSFCNPPDQTTFFNCGASPGYKVPPFGHGGTIQHTLGSPRFLQLALHLKF
jgi:carboxypeptidase family protein